MGTASSRASSALTPGPRRISVAPSEQTNKRSSSLPAAISRKMSGKVDIRANVDLKRHSARLQDYKLGRSRGSNHSSGVSSASEEGNALGSSTSSSKAIQVVVRVRPLSFFEINQNSKDVILVDPLAQECTILVPKPKKVFIKDGGDTHKSLTFDFNRCYDTHVTTAEIYNEIPVSLVQSVLDGFNATIMAYGQTGSGKTFTMQTDPENHGLIPMAISQIFRLKEQNASEQEINVKISYLEIYNEEIRDLLSSDPTRRLEIKGENPQVQDVIISSVRDKRECEALLRRGLKQRVVSATVMNEHSSRSHAILSIWIDNENREIRRFTQGKLNLVDLAGSERHGKTGISNDEGIKFTESKSINLSLTTLGKVIQALSSKRKTHVPYRDSKLTRLLQDSLGGNSRTLIIACLSPAEINYEESLSTLKYAHSAKNINNRPVVSVETDPKDILIRELRAEIRALKRRLGYTEKNQ